MPFRHRPLNTTRTCSRHRHDHNLTLALRFMVEATGGREVPLAVALQAAGLSMTVVNPRQTREFGRALGQLAKTDHLERALGPTAAHPVPPAVATG